MPLPAVAQCPCMTASDVTATKTAAEKGGNERGGKGELRPPVRRKQLSQRGIDFKMYLFNCIKWED